MLLFFIVCVNNVCFLIVVNLCASIATASRLFEIENEISKWRNRSLRNEQLLQVIGMLIVEREKVSHPFSVLFFTFFC